MKEHRIGDTITFLDEKRVLHGKILCFMVRAYGLVHAVDHQEIPPYLRGFPKSYMVELLGAGVAGYILTVEPSRIIEEWVKTGARRDAPAFYVSPIGCRILLLK